MSFFPLFELEKKKTFLPLHLIDATPAYICGMTLSFASKFLEIYVVIFHGHPLFRA